MNINVNITNVAVYASYGSVWTTSVLRSEKINLDKLIWLFSGTTIAYKRSDMHITQELKGTLYEEQACLH